LTLLNGMMLAIVFAIIGAAAVPIIEMASHQAKSSTLLQNLHILRSQINLYKLEHGGKFPLHFQGSLPQLIRPTNGAGIPGEPGEDSPYGPYLRNGIPVNPMTNRSIITLTETFPPTAPSGNGGWIYHQETGQIAPDLKDFLTE
jgi:general secretion pathway protein G